MYGGPGPLGRPQPFSNMGMGMGDMGDQWQPNPFMNRRPYRVNCGELRRKDIGKVVELAGKLHKMTRERFIQLKDFNGITQLVVSPARNDLQRRFSKMPLMSYIAVVGDVRMRPGTGYNEKMNTGEIEVEVHDILVVKTNSGNRRQSTSHKLPSGRVPPSEANPPKVTSDEYNRFHKSGLIPRLNERQYTCADLSYMIGKQVSILGWVERTTKRFIFVSDGYGKIQGVVPTDKDQVAVVVEHIKPLEIVNVVGTVTMRPETQINPASMNGQIELHLERIDWPVEPIVGADMDLDEESMSKEANPVNAFTSRTHTCGELRVSHVGQSVTLYGWMHFQRLGKFLVMRDAYGLVQCMLNEQEQEPQPDLTEIPLESVLKVEGTVVMRPPSTVHEDMSTGEVEVLIKTLSVLNQNLTPLQVANGDCLKAENLRLENRFVDLRTTKMQSNLRLRSRLLQGMRNFLLDNYAFTEVETPALAGRTLQEWQDFLVLTQEDDMYFALSQSAQVHSQLLMAGGFDRCFHVAKCFRDEPMGADRQPEFTQLHIEISFASQEDVFSLVEQMLMKTYPKALQLPPFPRMTYAHALETFGSPTPDLRYKLKLQSLEPHFSSTEPDFGAFVLIMPKDVKPKSLSDATNEEIKKIQQKYPKVTLTTDLKSLGPELEKKLKDKFSLDNLTLCFVAYGHKKESCISLGEVRVLMGRAIKELKISEAGLKPVWIIEQPVLESDDSGNFYFTGQPFSKMLTEDKEFWTTDKSKVRFKSFDLVINGNKYGGGGEREDNPMLLQKQIKAAKLSDAALAHFVKAISSGCPPHSGIALGVDRLVALACDSTSIRDVIAFPKAYGGKDLLAGTPFHHRLDLENGKNDEPSAKLTKFH